MGYYGGFLEGDWVVNGPSLLGCPSIQVVRFLIPFILWLGLYIPSTAMPLFVVFSTYS